MDAEREMTREELVAEIRRLSAEVKRLEENTVDLKIYEITNDMRLKAEHERDRLNRLVDWILTT